MGPDDHPWAEVLGRLLVTLQTLDVLPTADGMGQFLDRALMDVPGVGSAFLCLDGRISGQAAPAAVVENLACKKMGKNAACLLTNQSNAELIPLRTPRATFGCLAIEIADTATFAHYRSFLLNLGHMVATILENRSNASRLTESNTELARLVEELELRVEQRTRHIVEAQEQLHLSAKVFDSSAEAIVITDAEQRIVKVNRSFTTVTGYPPEEVIGRTPSLLASGRHNEAFYQNMWAALRHDGHWQGEIWNRRKNGQEYPEWLGISVVRNEAGEVSHYIGTFSDITRRKQAEAQIEFLAHHDPLTELANRVLFKARLTQTLAFADRSGDCVALLFVDLDNFKTINDSLGHQAGDAVLRDVAQRLEEAVRQTDTVARHGGDEFLVLLADVDHGDVVASVAAKILDSLDRPIIVNGNEVQVSASIGIALYPADGRDLDALLRNADTAMYQAKESGRNTYRFYAESMNGDAAEHLRLRNSLRRALANNDLLLHYQPQFDLATGAVLGSESLIRWPQPDGSLLPPGRFIPIAEASGLIVPIGEFVLKEACRQAAAWRDAGLPPMVVAVNLSAIQFKRGNLEDTVAQALAATGLAPNQLDLELTESILLQDSENVLATLRRLKALGVTLSIDDFGTGYSSLAYLKRLAVDKLKIDQSFVHNLANDPENRAIVQAVVQMAHSLGLQTIAEGVEDETSLEILRDEGCDAAQGFLLGRPMQADTFAHFVTALPAGGFSQP